MNKNTIVVMFDKQEGESFLQRFISLVYKRQYSINFLSFDLDSGIIHVTLQQLGTLPLENFILQVKNMYNCSEVLHIPIDQ